jgi:hypothetical protein
MLPEEFDELKLRMFLLATAATEQVHRNRMRCYNEYKWLAYSIPLPEQSKPLVQDHPTDIFSQRVRMF